MIPILSKIIVSAMTSGVVSLGKKDNFLESIKVRIMKTRSYNIILLHYTPGMKSRS